MGCNSSVPKAVKEPNVKVLQVNIHMTYDEDDSDNETLSPIKSQNSKIITEKVSSPLAQKKGVRETLPHHPQNMAHYDHHLVSSQHQDSTTTFRAQPPNLNWEADSDDDSEFFYDGTDEDADSDDEATIHEENEENVTPTLKTLLTLIVSISRDKSADSDTKLGYLSSRSCSFDISDCNCDCDHEKKVIQKQSSVEHLHSKISLSWSSDSKDSICNQTWTQSGDKDTHNNAQSQHEAASGEAILTTRNSPVIRSQLSFKSESADFFDDDMGGIKDGLMLRGILSVRSTALMLREEAKQFRNILKTMEFDDPNNMNCKYTCTYILYKMKKIIALNSSLSKFVNENALNFLNPFCDHTELITILHSNLRKLLTCILRTKVDKITVNGEHSKYAIMRLVAIYKLVADLSPQPAAIEATVQAIRKKLIAWDE